MPVSITLGLWSTLLAYLISIPLGIRKAIRDGTRFDTATSGVIIVAYAIPSFLFAIMLLVLFAGGSYWRIFPLRGLTSDNWETLSLGGKILDYLWHIALPVTASTIGAFATMTLLTKNSFLDEIKKQYVITARAKGLTERRVLYGHVFRNAMLIVIAGFPAVFISVFFGGSPDHRDDLLARRPRPARLRERDPARLPGGLRHALRLRPARARRRAALRPHLRLGRSAHRLRDPRDLMRLDRPAAPPPRQLQGEPARLLVALDLPRALPRHALRRVRRQRPAARRPLPRRASSSRCFNFYSEADFGGEFQTEAEYPAPEVRCLIRTGGVEACLDDPEGIYAEAEASGTADGQPIAQPGWMLWPPIPYSFDTINYDVATAPSPPDRDHWLGTDDQTRDVVARVIYGFRISVLFALVVAVISSLIGIVAGAVPGLLRRLGRPLLPAHRRDLGRTCRASTSSSSSRRSSR